MAAVQGSAVAARKRLPPPPPPPPPMANNTVGVVVQPQPPPSHPRQQNAGDRGNVAFHTVNAALHVQQPSRALGMNQQSHDHQFAVPPPPPPPATATAVPEPQRASTHADNAEKPQFRTVTFRRTLSQDSGSISNASSSLTSHFKDQQCLLSPKLQSFFNISNDAGEGGRTPKGGGKDAANLLFSPTQLDESNEISLLHSIFSPKFHARSAKKKKATKSRLQHVDERPGDEHQYCSIFSPNPDTPGKDAPGEDDVSAMSDEFGTITAILRGETGEPGASFSVEEIKKQVGLDPAHHPLSPKGAGVTKNVEREANREDRVDADDGNGGRMNVRFGATEEVNLDDSTEVMLDKARLLASGSAEKTPRVSPSSDDEFFTPASSAKSSSPPTALSFDVGRMSSGKGLPPVMEDEEMKPSEVVAAGEFRTPKQHGVGWKMDDFSQSQEDDEEFFSPLASHSIHTPSSKHKASPVLKNDSIFSLSISKDELSVTQSEVPPSDVPVAVAAPTRKSSSPGYLEAKEELQSLLKEAKGLSPPEKPQRASQKTFRVANKTPLQSVPSFGAHHTARNTPQSHLHSPSVSSLPRDAMTVDFVKQCECVDTLEAILSLLSDDRNANHRSGKSWGKQLRYPSLVRLVEKRLQKLQKDPSLQPPEEEWPVEVRPRMSARKQSPRYLSATAVDKENIEPIPKKQVAGKCLRETSRPMESITVLHQSNEGRGEEKQRVVRSAGSPSSAEGESSLDMDLSQSLLDEESYYWKQGMGAVDEDGEKATADIQPRLGGRKDIGANHNQHKASQTETMDDRADLKKANARLTGEVDSLFEELQDAKVQLQAVTEELSQLKASSAANDDSQREQIANLESANSDLREEVYRLQEQLQLFQQKAADDTRQIQDQLEEARAQNSDLAQDRDMLVKNLGDLRSIHENAQREVARLKLLLKKNASSGNEDARKMKRVVESAQLANKALAHALAVSEKDLAETNASKEKSAQDCEALRAHATELEDKTSFLSAKLKEMDRELKSSHVYIDRLFADLQAQESNRSTSEELKADFERRELEWVELERRYSQRIQQLEGQLVFDSKNQRVPLDAYFKVVEQTRHFKHESGRKEQEIAELKTSVRKLKERLDAMQRPSSSSSKRGSVGGKSMKALQRMKQVSPDNDEENVAPAKPRAQSSSNRGLEVKQQEGKQLSRVAAVKAHGGRKALSEQLKRARRFGGKAHNAGA